MDRTNYTPIPTHDVQERVESIENISITTHDHLGTNDNTYVKRTLSNEYKAVPFTDDEIPVPAQDNEGSVPAQNSEDSVPTQDNQERIRTHDAEMNLKEVGELGCYLLLFDYSDTEQEIIMQQPRVSSDSANHEIALTDREATSNVQQLGIISEIETLEANPWTTPLSGLGVLENVDQLLIMSKIEALEVITGFEGRNKYTIKNKQGQKLCYAVEQSSCFSRLFCGALRHFDMKIIDGQKNEFINFYRPLACQTCCFPTWLQSMWVSSPPGTVIGRIEQDWTLLTPKLRVLDAAGKIVYRISGPACAWSCCGYSEFQILTKDGSKQVGRICKTWSGLAKELFTTADHFGINFPMDVNVQMKALLLGACFLIDFMYFEKFYKM